MYDRTIVHAQLQDAIRPIDGTLEHVEDLLDPRNPAPHHGWERVYARLFARIIHYDPSSRHHQSGDRSTLTPGRPKRRGRSCRCLRRLDRLVQIGEQLLDAGDGALVTLHLSHPPAGARVRDQAQFRPPPLPQARRVGRRGDELGAVQRVVVGSWVDPFREPLSEENRAYVESHGKWTAFDTSATPEMAPLVEQIVRRVLPIRDQAGLRRGVQLDLGDEQVTYVVDGDEGFVYRGPATIELRMLGFFLDPLDAPALDSRPHEQD